jgi:hypothetical protein
MTNQIQSSNTKSPEIVGGIPMIEDLVGLLRRVCHTGMAGEREETDKW